MKDIVTGACLIAMGFLAACICKGQTEENARRMALNVAIPNGARMTLIASAFLAVAWGFSGCGIFIRGVLH